MANLLKSKVIQSENKKQSNFCIKSYKENERNSKFISLS